MMGFWSNMKSFLYPEDDYLEEEYEMSHAEVQNEQEVRHVVTNTPNNVIPFQTQSPRQAAKIFVLEPSVYSEAERIADALLKGEAVIVNFRRMDKADAQRVIDFAVGVAYAIKGDVQKIREEIFICSPASIQVQGTFDDEFIERFGNQDISF